MGIQKWGYKPDTFKDVDTNKDGLLNYPELSNYYKTLYPNRSTQEKHANIDNILNYADINKDGSISNGELALYKSRQNYLDGNAFKTALSTDNNKNTQME